MTGPVYGESAPYYDLIYEDIVDYARECDFLEELFRRHAGRAIQRVLDLGCGTGNHALVLADRGYEVVGVDLSGAFIARAREKARDVATPPTFLEGDMRNLRVEGPFDAAIIMFGAFGHIAKADASPTLEGVAARLAEGGLLLFEFWNPAGAQDGHEDWLERNREGARLLRLGRSRLREAEGSLEIRFKYYLLRGGRLEDEFEEVATMALYAQDAMVKRLRGAGFCPVAMLDWSAKSLDPVEGTPFRILAVARRTK